MEQILSSAAARETLHRRVCSALVDQNVALLILVTADAYAVAARREGAEELLALMTKGVGQ